MKRLMLIGATGRVLALEKFMSRWLIVMVLLVASLTNARSADLCYDPPEYSGMFCMGFFGVGCTTTTPIRNISSSTITDTTIIHAFQGFEFDMGNKIGIDGDEKTVNLDGDEAEFSGTLNDYTNFNGFVDFNIFGKGIVYRTGDYAPSSSISDTDQHEIYIYNLISMSFSAEKYLARYTKDGTEYYTRIYPCNTKLVSLTPQSQSVTEGNSGTTKTVTFTVTLSEKPTADKVNVNYSINPGTATEGTDYSASPYIGTLTFNKNTTTLSQTITASVIGDDVNESNETFVITLISLSQGSESFQIDESFQNGTVTIINDDDMGGGGVTPPIASAYANVDVVDGYSGSGAQYASWIKTKVSGQPGVQLSAVYLGNDPLNPVPQAYDPSGNNQQAASITILFKLADMSGGETCENAPWTELNTVAGGNTPVVARIDPDDVNASSNAFIMGYVPLGTTTLLAKKDVRIKYKAVDFNQLILDSGIQCAQRSSTGGVVEGIPACLIAQPNDTSDNQNKAIQNYTTIFGQTAYEQCYTQNGEPCAAANGGVGVAPYDHEYGCFECSIGAMPYTCSKDNFAIRPDKFAITSTHYDWANILRSGEDYNLSVYAYDYGISSGTDGSNDYNITGATSLFDLNTTKYFKNGAVADDTQMHGTAVWSAYDFNMSDGLSWSVAAPGTSEVAGTQFDDVGKINLKVVDANWSAVDINNPNDPTPEDCSASGAWICGDHNVTYIPHHFDFYDLNITNNNGNPGTFTYIANEVAQMAGRIHTKMRALNKDGNETRNFAAEIGGNLLWENNVTVMPVVTIPISKYIHNDANETNITSLMIGFSDGNKTVAWDETNTSQYLRFNFPRDYNGSVLPIPFDVNGSELNITISSLYTDPDTTHTANILGDRNETADANASFVYGRLIPRDVRVFGENVNVIANAWYEVYQASSINGTSLPPSRNDNLWYVNKLHDDLTDGNGMVTQLQTFGAASQTISPAIGGASSNGIEMYDFGPKAIGNYKAHIHLLGPVTSAPWLWYGVNAQSYIDPAVGNTEADCFTHPCFNITVVPAIGATGSQQSGGEVDKTGKKSDSGGGTWKSRKDYAPAVR